MTNELEKRFFDTFGIEPYDRYYNCKDNLEGECTIENTCCCCDKSEDVYCYPQITDRHYLKLIKILASAEGLGTVYITNLFDNWIVEGACRSKERFENLESAILHYSCRIAHCLNEKEKHQVRTLFEEE